MQDTFLNVYPKLSIVPDDNSPEGTSALPSGLSFSGLWLAHGDEPLLHQWLIDAMRAHWRSQNLAIQRVELVSPKTWQDVLGELNSLSLFDDANAVIVTGNHKPDKHVQAELEQFAIDATAGNNTNSLLWLTGKLDKRAQNGKWITPFAKYGTVIESHLYNENQRQQLLALHAQRFGLNLLPETWQFLMVQTEHHLLSAYQALWRLSYLYAPEVNAKSTQLPTHEKNPLITIDIPALQNALVSSSQYSVFDLSDAMLAGNAPQVIKIIEQLKSTDEPTPLVLWAISKDMRLIMQLMGGEDPQKIGIWRSKQGLYQSACRRQNAQSISDWPDILYQCDKSVKGVLRQPAWELILQAALRVTGHRLFSA